MEKVVNNTQLDAMSHEKLRQERAAAKREHKEARQLKVMLWPAFKWFSENVDVETSLQAKDAMNNCNNPAHRTAWET